MKMELTALKNLPKGKGKDAPAPALDFSKLKAGPHGRQNDPDMKGSLDGITIVRFISVPVATLDAHPEEGEFLLDPTDLYAKGLVELHPKFLVAARNPATGQVFISDREDVEGALITAGVTAADGFLADAVNFLGGLVSQIPGSGTNLIGTITSFLGKLLGL